MGTFSDDNTMVFDGNVYKVGMRDGKKVCGSEAVRERIDGPYFHAPLMGECC
jgi:hypothetical protein